MVDRISNHNIEGKTSNINRKDLELIFEVNKKAIEVKTEVAVQNEDIIRFLDENKEAQTQMNEKLNKLVKQGDETNKDIFKLQVLFVTGLLSLVVQIIQIFLKK